MTAFWLLALLLLPAPDGTPVPIFFDDDSLLRHRIAGDSIVTQPMGRTAWGGFPVRVVISPAGAVIAARVDRQDNDRGVDTARAVAAARGWRFHPFTYRGRPVAARGRIWIDYRPPVEWRDRNARFPPIDHDRLSIRLVRSGCFGDCPAYEVTIDGAGNVVFSTGAPPPGGDPEGFSRVEGVLLGGIHRARIDRAALDALIERFRQARFFGLRRNYVANISDIPSFELTFTTGGRSHTVLNYGGIEAGMPPALTALEDAVDEAAGTARWVHGDAATISVLRSEGFDFASRRAASLSLHVAGAYDTSEQVAIDLIEAGVPLDQSVPVEGSPDARLGERMVLAAIQARRPRLFAVLAARGWLARVPRERLVGAFASYGGGCHPAIARALVAAGVDPQSRTPASRPGTREVEGRTALASAVHAVGPCHGVEPGPVAAELIALGVDVNAADATGQTALYHVGSPQLQDLLLAAGARVDVRDREGNSPVFSVWVERLAIALLDAGADPRGRSAEGRTLRQEARLREMPAVIAWLDAHGIE
ncbi:MAG TPA: DUF6438 domain-containing protein [Allosphingosinicella sp.]|jgi:hypothetical protein|nr:DUF6438 domain-containing protein [Allosphingosinicella sp.]